MFSTHAQRSSLYCLSECHISDLGGGSRSGVHEETNWMHGIHMERCNHRHVGRVPTIMVHCIHGCLNGHCSPF